MLVCSVLSSLAIVVAIAYNPASSVSPFGLTRTFFVVSVDRFPSLVQIIMIYKMRFISGITAVLHSSKDRYVARVRREVELILVGRDKLQQKQETSPSPISRRMIL